MALTKQMFVSLLQVVRKIFKQWYDLTGDTYRNSDMLSTELIRHSAMSVKAVELYRMMVTYFNDSSRMFDLYLTVLMLFIKWILTKNTT